MLTNAARTVMLDALDIDHLSAHSAYPGHTGANELAGGVYAREPATMNAATGTPPTRSLNAAALIEIPGGSTVAWIGLWSALTGGNFYALSPNGGSPKEFEVDITANTILDPDNAVADDDKVVFYNGAPPTGLTAGTVYYVRDRTAALFKVAATVGGAAIDLTAIHDTGCVYSKIVEEVFSADGQANVATFVAGLNL